MKKVLIISYYWPPAGGPGVQRWLKFAKYLPESGVEPIVYVPENPTYPILDEKLIAEVPEGLTLLKKKITEPYKWASFFSKNKTKSFSSGIIPKSRKQSFLEKCLLMVRGNLFIPDARVLWVKPSVAYLKEYIAAEGIDTIITTGPPHSLHLIGMALKSELQLRWIADFRDPWTTIGYHKALRLSAYAERKHKMRESKVLRTADHIVVTSKTTKAEFEALTPQPITVITNGYDVEPVAKQTLDEKFTLAHIGSLLSERNPRILWKCLKELIKENPDFKKDFQLKLIGAVSQEVLDAIAEFRLGKYLNTMGYVSHQRAVEEQRKSQVLLLIEINSEETKSIIPGKLFEYMVSERPIIAMGPEDSDFEEIVRTTNTGVFIRYSDMDLLKETLLKYYKDYQNKTLQSHAVGLQHYSRKQLTKQLAELILK
ncbi:glycosyltransferase family 4 protein [Flavobacterium kingsejongi]|uniref:Glycosyl transferase family 1 n=1 Tax=Flavobacterium kingsejongi TaxID=1678728 RepID=A0A2S1LQG3_9FLAO|nr:glycosyltransferase family 4 protein [Flavobacterium kingsejongi]AWG25886.1 glycosyl transferase family 1 [Flavobacterium kingsejongi]